MGFFKRPDDDSDSAIRGRDDLAILGVRLDKGKEQVRAMRLDKIKEIISPAVEKDAVEIAEQLAIVEELEREFSKLPESVQKTIAGDLMMARNALGKGQKVSSATIANLTQARNDQEMRILLQAAGCGAFVLAPCATCSISGGEDVSREGLFTPQVGNGIDGVIARNMLRNLNFAVQRPM